MDINLAKTYLAVVDTGSFVAAAERLHVTQSTVSSRIKSLEDMIGQPLFERSKAGASLTPAGHQFHKHALALVRVWEHAQLEVGLADEHKDHLTIGGQVSLWDGFLLHWVSLLRGSHPSIAVTAAMGYSTILMERLTEGTMDLAVMYRLGQRPGLIVEHIFDEELVMVSSVETDKFSADTDYAFVNWGPEFQADHAMAFPTMSHPGLYLDIGSLGVNYLLDKKASGYFPIRVARPYLDRGELHLVKRTPRFVYPVYVVFPEQRDEDAYLPILKSLRQMAAELESNL